MTNAFQEINVLRSQAQLKGWSNRPEVPLMSRWRKKSSKPLPTPTPKLTTTADSPTATERNMKLSTSPAPTSSRGSTWTGSTTNVLLIHPICRCCTDVVNSITRPYRRRTSKTTTPAGSSGRKATWDGLPSTHYVRLWPQPDDEKLREAKLRPERSRVATCSSPLAEKKPKKKQQKRIWKFWPSIL